MNVSSLKWMTWLKYDCYDENCVTFVYESWVRGPTTPPPYQSGVL